MAKKSLNECRTCKDFDRAIRSGGVTYQERQNGSSHRVYKFTDKGVSVPIPQHRGDIPTGTRRSIVKMLTLVGLGGVVWIVICQASTIISRWLSLGGGV
ncbi:MAG: type II toxin-antitoxin system HicA family toxin [Chloroflexota bacterium]